jgi:hypothetical protein
MIVNKFFRIACFFGGNMVSKFASFFSPAAQPAEMTQQ